MISSQFWDKSAQVNFQCLKKKITSADLSQIAREKPVDYLLIIFMQNLYTANGCQTRRVRPLTFLIPCFKSIPKLPGFVI